MVIILLFVWDFMWIKSLVLNMRRRLDCFLCSVSMLIIACGIFRREIVLIEGAKNHSSTSSVLLHTWIKLFIEKTYEFIRTNNDT